MSPGASFPERWARMARKFDISVAVNQGDALGESPVWCAREQALYWVDITAQAIYRRGADAGLSRWATPATIGSIGLCQNGDILTALRDGVYVFSATDNTFRRIATPDSVSTNRLNDGKVSPEGRFWIGSMDDRADKLPVAALFSLEADLSTRRKVNGLRVSNGLAWSPDGRILYHSDSRAATVWRYDYAPESGELGEQQIFITYQPEWGRPDGAAVDSEGCYWSAGVTAGRLNRFDPDGRLISFIELPASHITMPCFGGPQMKTIFVTSSRADVAPERRAAMPLAGALFAIEQDIAGVAVGEFTGDTSL